MKKLAGGIIILHISTKNHNHMMYSCWDSEWDRQNSLSLWAIFCPFTWDMVRDRCNCYSSFWAIFCPFTPLTTQKIKILILIKWRKCLETSSFYICVPKIMIRWCTVPEIWYVKDVILYFGPFFPFNPRNSPKNQNFEIMKKKHREI